MIKAFAYLRQSTNRVDMQEFSLPKQERIIEELRIAAEKQLGEEVKILHFFIEKISGGNDERPEFQKMCDGFKKWIATHMFSWKLNRISRNPLDSGFIMHALQKWIIKEIRASEGVFNKKNSGLVMGMFLAMGNEEILKLAEDSAAGTRELIEAGWYPAKAPQWYINVKDAREVKDKIKVDPRAAHFMLRSFEMLDAWASFDAVSNFLFSEGFKNKNWGKFSVSTIESWIRNPFYYWVMKWGEYFREHIYPPIIPRPLWERVNKRKRAFSTKKEEFILKWIIKSADSQRILTASLAKWKHVMYHTHSRYKWKETIISIPQSKIIEFFDNNIHAYVVPPEVKPFILSNLKEYYKNQIETVEKEKKFTASELTKLKNQIDSLLDLRISWELSAELFKEKQKEYTNYQNELTNRLNNAAAMDDSILTTLSEAVELFSNLDVVWKNADPNKKLRIIKCIAVELFIDSDKMVYIKEKEVFEWLRFLNSLQMEVPSGVEPL